MGIYEVFCRVYQGVFKVASPIFPWRNPELVEGAGSLSRIPSLLSTVEVRKPLVVTDAGLAKLGLHRTLLGILDASGFGYKVFDGTVPNPTIGNIEDALVLFKDGGCDCIVAFGGGSAMDCAKGVGARVARPRKSVASMKGLLKVGRAMPYFVAIPTTAGTGSEATLAAVISNPDTHEKYPINDHALIPHAAILDPELTLGLPPSITATTGMDALTHAVEAFIGRSNTAQTEQDAVEATAIIMADLESLFQNGNDVEKRARMLRAAHLAGRAFTRAYVGYVHAIAHTLGGFYGVPHGLANAVILPIVLEYFGAAAWPRLALLARRAGLTFADVPGAGRTGTAGSDESVARAFIARIRAMNAAMGIPATISAIKAEDIPAMVGRALSEANPLYPVPAIYRRAEMTELYGLVAGKPGA